MKTQHQPVLLNQVTRLLNPQPGESYLDCTAGYGGHAADILSQISGGLAVLVDRDVQAVKHLQQRFDGRAEIIHESYLDAATRLYEAGQMFDLILLDLGVSSPQLDEAKRGFSFKANGPLDMRMDQSSGITAAEIVNGYSESQLADLIYHYGEERRSRRVARAIVSARPFSETAELAKVIRKAVGPSGDIDPATRTFQALRIETNQELDQLTKVLPLLENLLTPGGRMAVISFHSLEDRIVKQYFDRQSKDCICPPKQPVCNCNHQATLEKLGPAVKGSEHDQSNPRARSAKLRAARKLKPKQKGGQL